MGVQYYENEEDMEDAFEAMMEAEQDKARLREEIEEAEHTVDCCEEELQEAKMELAELRKQLERLED